MTIYDKPVLLQIYARAPAPCRDYYGLTVSDSHVILNIWNISHGPHVYPKRQKSTLEDFHEEKYLQNEIKRIFGTHIYEFTLRLASNEHNLQYLPTRVFLRILRYLSGNDILHVSQTSKIFFEICSTEAVWKVIFRKRLRKVMYLDEDQAENIGWKAALKSKMIKRNIVFSKKDLLNNNNNNNLLSKKDLLNNKAVITKNNLLNSVVKRPDINVIKNISVKTVKSVSLVNKVANVTAAEKRNNTNKNILATNPIKSEQKCLKVAMNRSQTTYHRVTNKCSGVGDVMKKGLDSSTFKKDVNNKALINKKLNLVNKTSKLK